ncbi:MAG TPA: acetolactate synthase small subunit [Bacillota bacterium]|nr:acetolactate synthase small subunit [Peptococcaceae bacterium MAG4]NLW38046.1 acetolactate synthase small subunit [Peptococcaceae bacterium]HPU35958.1 acetolactate synthase small subunit [Bacillota bacterium]HPZ43097.1 acetolactate synthase small subunit [Bacillota bacterium]HQD75211.1 acetolactate synthase small subunit [Bacillota bacterium]
MKSTLAVLVVNKPGVLARISGLLSRRVFNIESIAAGYTEEPDVTRITLVVQGDTQVLNQVMRQLSKLVDVIKVVELKSEESVERELALVKVRAEPNRRSDIVNLVSVFRANIIDVNKETMIIEILGDEKKITALCSVLEDYGIVEMVRTGKVVLSRGPGAVKHQPV